MAKKSKLVKYIFLKSKKILKCINKVKQVKAIQLVTFPRAVSLVESIK